MSQQVGVDLTPLYRSPSQLQGEANWAAQQLANTQAKASNYGVDAAAKANMYGSDKSLLGVQSQSDAQKYGYDQQLASQKYSSDASRAASEFGSTANLQGTKYSSDASKAAALGTAQYGLQGTQYSSDASKAASIYGSDASRAASEFGSTANLQGTKYSSDASRAASEFGASEAARAALGSAQAAAEASRYGTEGQNSRYQSGLDWAQQRFGKVFDFIKQQEQMAGVASESSIGGAPPITAAPTYTPDQVQQNVNNAVGLIDRRTATANSGIAQAAAGRGMGGSYQSPLVQALMGANTAGGNASAAEAELGARQNAAQQNQSSLLASQQAAYQGWNQTQALNLQAKKNVMDYNASLINALSGLGSYG